MTDPREERPDLESGRELSAIGTSERTSAHGPAEGPADGREARLGRPPSDPAAAGPATGQEPGQPGGSGVDGQAQQPGGERRASGRRSFTRGLILTLLLGLAALAGLVVWGLMPVSDTSQLVEFEVMPGWGASRVAEELENADLVRSGELFSAYLRVRGLDRSIGEGLYDLDRASPAPQLAETLVAGGRPRVAEVLLPEGVRASELAQRLEEAGLHPAAEYQSLIDQPGELGPDHLPEGAGLEGYLFPASYEIPFNEPPQETLERMLERFEQELTEAVRLELERREMSVHEWVTIASIVQSEAGGSEEMPIIAGVFLNRLDRGMALQSDPTVAYGLGKSMQELDPLAGDMGKDHPWNTYTRPGLPQGPISNPGHDALQSVLAPVRTDAHGEDYLYFIHGFDGGDIVFRPNIDLESHNEDVAQYLR